MGKPFRNYKFFQFLLAGGLLFYSLTASAAPTFNNAASNSIEENTVLAQSISVTDGAGNISNLMIVGGDDELLFDLILIIGTVPNAGVCQVCP